MKEINLSQSFETLWTIQWRVGSWNRMKMHHSSAWASGNVCLRSWIMSCNPRKNFCEHPPGGQSLIIRDADWMRYSFGSSSSRSKVGGSLTKNRLPARTIGACGSTAIMNSWRRGFVQRILKCGRTLMNVLLEIFVYKRLESYQRLGFWQCWLQAHRSHLGWWGDGR